MRNSTFLKIDISASCILNCWGHLTSGHVNSYYNLDDKKDGFVCFKIKKSVILTSSVLHESDKGWPMTAWTELKLEFLMFSNFTVINFIIFYPSNSFASTAFYTFLSFLLQFLSCKNNGRMGVRGKISKRATSLRQL